MIKSNRIEEINSSSQVLYVIKQLFFQRDFIQTV